MRAYRGQGFRVFYDVVRDQVEPGASLQTVRAGEDAIRYYLGLQAQGLVPADREAFCALYLNARHRTIGFHICSIGTLNSAPVAPANVFRPAIALGAMAVIVAHHHPSGDCTPSAEDRRVTERLTECGQLLGVQLLDHLVIGRGRFYSFADGRHQPIAVRDLLDPPMEGDTP